MPIGYSPKLPLSISSVDGPYALTKTQQEMIRQNLKNLVLTSPGERIMDPEFGVGIRSFLFEQKTEIVQSEIRERIYRQVNIYLPFVEILGILFGRAEDLSQDPLSSIVDSDENLLSLSIVFRIKPLNVESSLTINLR